MSGCVGSIRELSHEALTSSGGALLTNQLRVYTYRPQPYCELISLSELDSEEIRDESDDAEVMLLTRNASMYTWRYRNAKTLSTSPCFVERDTIEKLAA